MKYEMYRYNASDTFNNILDRLNNRTWISLSDFDAVEMIIEAYNREEIDEEEKELLLDHV